MSKAALIVSTIEQNRVKAARISVETALPMAMARGMKVAACGDARSRKG